MAARMETDDTAILSITNWTGSKASNDPDGGVSSLERWLGNKAKRPILASQRDGEVLQIQIHAKDKRSFLHVDGWRWAGVDIKISDGQIDAPPRGPRNNSVQSSARGGGFNSRNGDLSSRMSGGPNNTFNSNQSRGSNREVFGNAPQGPRGGGFQQNRHQNGQPPSSPFSQVSNNSFGRDPRRQQQQPDAVQTTLIEVVRKRYNAAEKFLDLSALALEPLIQQANLTTSTADKVFSALFVVIEQHVFETREKRAEMIESVSFKNNSLKSVKEIIGAGSTFYKVKNLDLSENQFTNIRDLTFWKNRFPDLEQIILAGNPVDSPQTREEVRRWYRKLKGYNLQPLDAPFVGGLETTPPVPVPSPAPQATLTTAGHPEFPPDSTFGQPVPNKPEDQLIKEQMGLKFSFETGLKMQFVEECLVQSNFNYDQAVAAFNTAMTDGNVPADCFIQA